MLLFLCLFTLIRYESYVEECYKESMKSQGKADAVRIYFHIFILNISTVGRNSLFIDKILDPLMFLSLLFTFSILVG